MFPTPVYLLVGLGVSAVFFGFSRLLKVEYGLPEAVLVVLIWPSVIVGTALLTLYEIFSPTGKNGKP
jgi:hypothetical protein